MNNEEYYSCSRSAKPEIVKEAFDQWKRKNGYTCKCVIHHRDDTEETIKYNSEHYELWGCDLDGTFEYGKYVIFMTNSEHIRHHKPNDYWTEESHVKQSASLTGRVFTAKHREKIGAKLRGRTCPSPSDETRHKMSESHKGTNNAMYGKHHSDETRKRLSKSATQRIGSKNGMYGKRHSEDSKQKMRNSIEKISQCYAEYKSNGGELLWKAFRHALSIGDISMEALNEQ